MTAYCGHDGIIVTQLTVRVEYHLLARWTCKRCHGRCRRGTLLLLLLLIIGLSQGFSQCLGVISSKYGVIFVFIIILIIILRRIRGRHGERATIYAFGVWRWNEK
jgi:hypothetical protein